MLCCGKPLETGSMLGYDGDVLPQLRVKTVQHSANTKAAEKAVPTNEFEFSVALLPSRPQYALLGTGSAGRPPRLSHSS